MPRIRAANICSIENLDDARVTGGYADWRGHVIVCGLRFVGLRIVEELNQSGVPAVSSTTTRIRRSPASSPGGASRTSRPTPGWPPR
jgi:hypothetical protein